jgi:hypothetical protein
MAGSGTGHGENKEPIHESRPNNREKNREFLCLKMKLNDFNGLWKNLHQEQGRTGSYQGELGRSPSVRTPLV